MKFGLLRLCKGDCPDQYYMSLLVLAAFGTLPFGSSFILSSVILNFHLQPEGVGDVETASYVAAFPAMLC